MNMGVVSKRDEYNTPDEYLDVVLPYLEKATWVDPFTVNSTNRIVKYWRKRKIDHVVYHGNFFNYTAPDNVFVWSNPPYSIKKKIINKLLKDKVHFILLVPLQTMATKYATTMLKTGDIKISILSDRWPFYRGEEQMGHKPPFGMIYVYNLPWDLPLTI